MTQRTYSWRETMGPGLALFMATSTLLCCALPALLITLGMGAVVAGLVVSVPFLVTLSAYKAWLFAGSAALIAAAGWSHARAARLPCPADPAKAAACRRLRRLSAGALIGAAAVWAVGLFAAYLLPALLFGPLG